MKQKIWILSAAAVLLIGVALTAYPLVSTRHNERHQSKVQASYLDCVAEADESEMEAAKAAARAYNAQLLSGVVFGETEGLPYDSLLNPAGTGMMGYLEIPAIGVSLPIYHGTGESSLDKGVGHLSSLPIGGIGTHAVLTAHSGMATEKRFTDLDLLQAGDIFILHILDEALYYEVDQKQTVLPTDSAALKIDPNQDYVTLVTCTPYGVNSHRLLVRGHRVEQPEAAAVQVAEPAQPSTWGAKYRQGIFTGCLLAAGIGAVTAGVLLWRRKRARQ